MSAYLFEGHRTIYVLLLIVLVLLALVWWQTRKREVALAAAVTLGLVVCYFLLDLAVTTDAEADRKQMQERIEAMAQAVALKDVDRLFKHIGANFVSPSHRTRAETFATARSLLGSGSVTEVRVWGFEFEKVPSRAEGSATVRFDFKGRGTQVPDLPFGCEATFEWSGSGGWMLRKVVIFDPVRGREPIPVPF